MSSCRKPLSKSIIYAYSKNVQHDNALQKELELLDKERVRHVMDIDLDTMQLRRQLAEQPSPTSPRLHGSRRASTSPRLEMANQKRAASSTFRGRPRPETFQDGSAHCTGSLPTSPRSSPLLRRRNTAGIDVHTKLDDKRLQVMVTDKLQRFQRVSAVHEAGYGDTGQFADTTSLDLKNKSSDKRTSIPGTPRSGSDSGSDREHSPLSSPRFHFAGHSRSLSMPVLGLSASNRANPPRSSSNPTDVTPDPNPTDSPRAHSSVTKAAQRKTSLPERLGTVPEHPRSHRRRSLGMSHDQRHGALHKELMKSQQELLVRELQWEELKNCRYLRSPGSQENVSLPRITERT